MRYLMTAPLALLLLAMGSAQAQVVTPNPILFVTQFPIPDDFAAIGSVFANHRGHTELVGRGGDLYIRYGDGTLRNLTRDAGYGEAAEMQGANAIAVRDPAVHWSGTKAVFSMVIGAPTQQYQRVTTYFQLYEVTGFGVAETVQISKVANQPTDTNNVMPVYASDGQIIFVSDRTRNGERHLYPQHDEYESTPTPTGLWKLNAQTGRLQLLQHSPSGSFDPIVDSFGRVLFTRWDHLQRDQQNDSVSNQHGTFNFSNESASATELQDRSEIFPEPRISVPGSGVDGFRLNHFFPWQVQQDGTGEETLNHLGRHELHSYFNRSFLDDANLVEFADENSGRVNPNPAFNFLQLHEDAGTPGRYYAIDAPEFATQNAGQIIRLEAPPSTNPATVQVTYVTHPDTVGTEPSANHSGHYRNPIVLANGSVISSHTSTQGVAGNDGTRESPNARYKFRLRNLSTADNGYQAANLPLTNGLSRQVQYWDPDELVSYNGEFWELGAVEVIARAVPAAAGTATAAPEISAYAQRNVLESSFKQYLRTKQLGVVVMRDVTARDELDKQQPFNLRVVGVGGRQTPAAPFGTVYDIAHMQFFQGDQIRGIRGEGNTDAMAGRRVLAQFMHDANAVAANLPLAGGAPIASVPIALDGSVAAFVPAGRALAWQTTATNGTPVVRERFWITLQPGEVRACDGCHGVNQANQQGQGASTQTAQAFLDLLARWNNDVGWLFADGME